MQRAHAACKPLKLGGPLPRAGLARIPSVLPAASSGFRGFVEEARLVLRDVVPNALDAYSKIYSGQKPKPARDAEAHALWPQ